MKCIDSIEGTVKCILNKMHNVSIEHHLDDSEYIRNAKAIIEATEQYIHNNPEVVQEPQLLVQVLYVHSRNLWLMQQTAEMNKSPDNAFDSEAQDYQTYYYDYIYNQNVYPR